MCKVHSKLTTSMHEHQQNDSIPTAPNRHLATSGTNLHFFLIQPVVYSYAMLCPNILALIGHSVNFRMLVCWLYDGPFDD